MTSHRATRIAAQPIWIRVTQWGIGHNTDVRDAGAMYQGGNPCGTSRYWSPGKH